MLSLAPRRRPSVIFAHLVVTLVLVTAGLTAGCTTTPSQAPTGGGPSTSGIAATSATPSPTGSSEITLAFAGDVHFAGRTLGLLGAPESAFGPVSAVLSAADLAMVNLESAVTDRGTPEPKQFHFRAPATAYQAIKAAGVDVVTVANNHALDYGRVGLADTVAGAQAAGMPLVGAGADAAAAYRPWITTVKGVRIGFVALSQIGELAGSWAAQDGRPGIAMAFDERRALAAVRAARAGADFVVVYMHWGQEYNQCPTGQQRAFAAKLSAAGADLIVGTHAHVLQGAGWLGHTYVAYGLSNFLWWYNDAGSNDTGVLRVTLSGGQSGVQVASATFVPTYIDRRTGQPIPSTGAEAARISRKFADLGSCTGLSKDPR